MPSRGMPARAIVSITVMRRTSPDTEPIALGGLQQPQLDVPIDHVHPDAGPMGGLLPRELGRDGTEVGHRRKRSVLSR